MLYVLLFLQNSQLIHHQIHAIKTNVRNPISEWVKATMASRLELDLLEAILPEGKVGCGEMLIKVQALMYRVSRRTGDAVLAVVEERNHAIGIHFFANVELIVLEVGNDLLCERGRALLEGGYSIGLALLELGLDCLHVSLEVREEGLFVERRRLETERVDNVVELRGTLLEGLIRLLGGGVGA